MQKLMFLSICSILTMSFLLISCSDGQVAGIDNSGNNVVTPDNGNNGNNTNGNTNSNDGNNGNEGSNNGSLPAGFSHFSSDVEIYIEGDYVVLKSDGIPNHGSPYFGSGDSRYEAYNGDNSSFRLNPNRILEQSYTFRIPLNPEEATIKESTPLGAIGISINGVPFYNQYAGPDQPLTNEINSFDQYMGHPQMSGAYHYHIEPTYLTATAGADKLIGYLLDGFPVYGPEENGRRVTNDDLDAYHGHFHATEDYPEGIYHYHITSEDPYLNGNGFFGAAGTVSN